MSDKFHIPPVFVDAEAHPAPPKEAFRKRPAQEFAVNDLLYYDEQAWRIVERRESKRSIKIRFTLYPVAGGRPTRIALFPREWMHSIAVPKSAQSD